MDTYYQHDRFIEAMVVESKKLLFNGSVLDKYGEYIRALSNAIKMMKEAENDTEV
ncbi:hypothetical protein [Streptococcus suis]|uniref:hypothetical protein n=1 Tax=Streptococcus suis TaxID=1307 RepID=UPI00211BFAEB|nr:hypothetical protein [Streptococcus suis]MCQ9227195.1 hypothetical protein [Streptococcus suis]MCQ9229506.1 hypothetical protein [Streptococcus suis]MCQ9243468.1 hypothetical protein [Streptococcus suis]MCQ9275746.1 hypothetical protein [Streptococcus suis]MDE7535841.1 hypothetical protein [Streptococcus suis]